MKIICAKLLTCNLRYANIDSTEGGETMPNTQKIQNRLKELGLTQSDLAAALSLATPTVSQKINNIRPTTLEEAEKMAKVLKIRDKEFGSYFFNQ